MTEPLPSRSSIALIGAGRVATAAATLLAGAGHRIVGVASRTSASATAAAQRLDAVVFDHRSGVPSGAAVVLIGAGDPAISEVATQISPFVRPGTIVWHLSGSLGTAPLAPIIDRGAGAAALHPVQACPDVDTAIERLPGSAWGVTCSDRDTERWAAEIVGDLEGSPVAVAEEDRPAWHAASVTTSNGIAALLAGAESMLAGIDVADPERVLGPLAAGTVANAISGGGGARTLTGPVVRGEVTTVERHVLVLEREHPSAAGFYRQVARLIVAAALDAGRIEKDVADRMHEVLS